MPHRARSLSVFAAAVLAACAPAPDAGFAPKQYEGDTILSEKNGNDWSDDDGEDPFDHDGGSVWGGEGEGEGEGESWFDAGNPTDAGASWFDAGHPTDAGVADECEELGWYGDGYCDVCPLPDPDCEPVTTPGGIVTMGDLVDQALAVRDDLAPGAPLFAVKGMGVDASGYVDLSSTVDYVPRWEFSFQQTSGAYLTVTWLTDAYAGDRPYIDENAGNVVEDNPLGISATSLPDSPLVVDRYDVAAACDAAGTDGHTVIYHYDDTRNRAVVSVSTTTDSATYALPWTTGALDACD